MNMLINFLLSSVVVYLAAIFLPGIEIGSFWTAIVVALVLAILNITVKPILQVLSIIPTLLTIGFFLLVINGAVIVIADWFVDDFQVANFGYAILFSIVVSVSNWILHRIFRR
jgi:Predicted membrane protein